MVADGPTSPRARGKQLDPAVKVKLDQFLAERSVSFYLFLSCLRLYQKSTATFGYVHCYNIYASGKKERKRCDRSSN